MLRKLIPKTCRAMLLPKASPAAQFQFTSNHPVRSPESHEVVVKIDACAVAYRDVLDRTGAFPFIKPNIALGHEFAGTVVSKGDRTNNLSIGDRVVSLHWDQKEAWPSPLTRSGPVNSFLGLTTNGGYSEYCTIAEGALVATPSGWNSIDAAPVMSTFGTIWQGAKVRANMTKKDIVLITGASGGVGSASIQLCKAMGCQRIIAVTSSSTNIDYLHEIGADHVIVTKKGEDASFHKEKIIHDTGGVDVVLENVGAPCFAASLKALRPEGRLVLIGNVSNAKIDLPLGLVILNSLKIVGSDSIEGKELKECFEFLTQHNVRPMIDQVMELEDVMEAHVMLENASTAGRVVLDISKDGWE